MRYFSNNEYMLRTLAGYLIIVLVYIITLPLSIVAALCLFLGQMFDCIVKTILPRFGPVEDISFFVTHWITKKKFNEEMKRQNEEVINKLKNKK